MKIWIRQDAESGNNFMYDHQLSYNMAGPIEISNELYERVRESDREALTIQDILDSLVYDWTYPDDEAEVDCD